MRATEECSGNLGSIFLIVFVFSVALSRCETIHLCIYFVVFPVNLIHLSWHHEFSFFLTQRLGIVGNSTSCPSLNSSYGNCYGEPESGKNRDFLHRVCLLSSGMIPRFSTMYPGKYFPRPMGWSWIFQTNQVMFIIKSTTHLLLGLYWWTHSGESMFLIWSYNSSKSSWLETRNGCSNTKLLLADGWWYCRALVSVFCRMKPNDKLILKTVGWSAKIWLSCSRRLWGLMVLRGGIVPVLTSVVAAKSGTNLGPVLSVRLSDMFVRAWNKVWRDKNGIRFPTGTCSCIRCLRSRMRRGW